MQKFFRIWIRSWKINIRSPLIPNNTDNRIRIFLSDSDSWCPVGSFFTAHSIIRNSCWNGAISFETSVEREISFSIPRFPFISTAKFHSLSVKESESGVGVGYSTSGSATLVVNTQNINLLKLHFNLSSTFDISFSRIIHQWIFDKIWAKIHNNANHSVVDIDMS